MEPIWFTGGAPGSGGVPLSARSRVTVWLLEPMLPPAETVVGLKTFEEETVRLPA